ncbi:MAG: cyclodeaminase/cyclohydrolase family protein [Helcococcus sp.]|nr:cyclodeaminase/cyclohydrolase family protein [Helcococcus sp.]
MEIKEYLKILEMADNRAGGGSVGAFSGAFAATLIVKAYNMMLKKETNFINLIDKKFYDDIIKIRDYYQESIMKDGMMFGEVIKAYKLPKNTDEEKSLRKNEIKKAYKIAYNSSLSLVENALDLFEYLLIMNKYVDDMAKSEINVAIAQINASIKSSYVNARLNLNYTLDDEFIERENNKLEDYKKKFYLYLEKCQDVGLSINL